MEIEWNIGLQTGSSNSLNQNWLKQHKLFGILIKILKWTVKYFYYQIIYIMEPFSKNTWSMYKTEFIIAE